MPDKTHDSIRLSTADIIIEALKIIKSEILAYAIIVAGLLIATASLGLDVLRELKWPLITVFTVALIAYFFARAIPRAKTALRLGTASRHRPDDGR